jgi:Domain of unknown function (DUF5047)
MRATSSQFDAALRGSHRVVVEATLHLPGEAPVDVPVQGGQVVDDRTAPIRRTGSLAIPWTLELERLGLEVDVRRLPFGSYVELRRGVQYADAQRELVAVGYLRCESVAWGTSEDTAALELADRMAQVRDEKLLVPYAAGGKTASAAAVELVDEVFGSTIGYTVDVGTEPVLVDVTYTGERAQAVADLATASSAFAYFDDAGNFVFEQPPDPTTVPPALVVDAGAEGVLVEANETLDRTSTVNGVLATGQAAADEPPLEALVVVDDATSPLVWGGPFGRVVLVVSSTAIQTTAQAQQVAAAELGRRSGLDRSLTIRAVPNPALVAGDVIEVVFPDGRDELHVASTIRLPLDATGAMEIATRSVFAGGGARARRRRGRARTYSGAQAWAELAGARFVEPELLELEASS